MAPHVAQIKAPVEVELSQPGIACVKLRGEQDLAGSPRLTEALAVASSRLNVLVDLSECTFMDSSVIAVFSRAGKKLGERGGRLELIIPPEALTLQRIASVSALSSMVPIHETHVAAVAGLRSTGRHLIQIRDLRRRFGDPEVRAAECTCGWHGEQRTGQQTAAREARRDGAIHVDEQRFSRCPR
jgi:anti-sigma B factor antagonist